MSRRWFWRALLGAYLVTLIGCACGVTGRVPWQVAARILGGNPAYAANQDWAASWQRYTNRQLRHEKQPERVTHARCAYHAGIFICSYIVTPGRRCMVALVDPTGLPVADPRGNPYVHRVPCSEVMPSTKLNA